MINLFKQISANNILLEPYPFLRELAMEAYLMENEAVLRLDDDTFSEPHVIDAEIVLKEGRRSGDGRIDLLAQYSNEVYAIAELKLEEIDEAALDQLQGYLERRGQLRRYIDPDNARNEIKWVGILVGKSISRALAEKLVAGYEYAPAGEDFRIPIAAITLNRYRSKQSTDIYVVSDTYFHFASASKDYSKYRFRGREYNKGQLVNAVLRYYVEQHPAITYAELGKAFPKRIQGSAGVFATEEDARRLYERYAGRYKRHQIDPEKLIPLSDAVVATSTQWSVGNIAAFIARAGELGLKIG